ncbi:AtpZ/AtpI family protein [Lichenihabitans sp. Uapishka_5]|uniref:AtpZ/AtpI family protein n=1 Tax=Lichenihabitans sp. Uapishka_5 TaxID=3037302 RepID=UPI0029E7CFB9|nr:AtpZ/AtpI family protein [Lichenihabitans sp. Uapishka_5]MDX7949987.1 AtpZ/AtpI family protein [Lichenihabitans sp. Uapishka_5]
MSDDNHDDMRDRLAKLSNELEARNAIPSAPAATPLSGPNSLGGAMSTGFRVMSEFVAAVAVGGLIGWQCDKWFGTSPILLILLLMLGTAAGFWTVYRIATKPTQGLGPR